MLTCLVCFSCLCCCQGSAAHLHLQRALGALLSQLGRLTGEQLRLWSVAYPLPAPGLSLTSSAEASHAVHLWLQLQDWLLKHHRLLLAQPTAAARAKEAAVAGCTQQPDSTPLPQLPQHQQQAINMAQLRLEHVAQSLVLGLQQGPDQLLHTLQPLLHLTEQPRPQLEQQLEYEHPILLLRRLLDVMLTGLQFQKVSQEHR